MNSEGQKWIKDVRRDATVFAGSGMTYAFTLSKNVGIRFEYQNVRYANFEWWFLNDEFLKLQKTLREIFKKNPKKYQQIIDNQFRLGEQLKKYITAISNSTFNKQQLLIAFNDYTEKLLSFYSFYVFISPVGAGEIVETRVREILAQRNINIPIQDLIYPHKLLNSTMARLSLLKIGLKKEVKCAKTYLDLNENLRGKLEKHATLYGWELYSFHLGKILTAEDYFKKIKLERNIGQELNSYLQQEKRRKEYDHLLQKSLTRKEYEVIKLLQQIIFFRNYQKETMNECQYKSIPFLTNIAKFLDISFSDLQLSTPFEIKKALSKISRVNKKLLKRRRKHFNVIIKGGICNITLVTPQKNLQRLRSDSKIITGLPACKGKVKGVVHIIKKKSDLHNFKKGEILVTSMTTVDFIGALKTAKAIITDEGGITCHAAIFSREFNIPCVIGTRVATNLLYDGDIVEVDADRGFIKMLN